MIWLHFLFEIFLRTFMGEENHILQKCILKMECLGFLFQKTKKNKRKN